MSHVRFIGLVTFKLWNIAVVRKQSETPLDPLPPLCLYKEEECQHLYTQLLFRVRATISRLSQAQTNILPPKTALQTIRIDVVCGPYVSAFERS